MPSRNIVMAILYLTGSWHYALTLTSVVGFAFKPGMVNDFYPMWNVSRAMLNHIDPYGRQSPNRIGLQQLKCIRKV